MPSARFELAAAYLSGSPSLAKVSNDVKLELYALFKCITVSRNPPPPRPSLFDFTGRAKWDAWDKLGKQNDGQDSGSSQLEARYLEIAKSLGWKDGQQESVAEGEENCSDNGETETRSGGGGGGMGVYVSAISQPPPNPEDEGTLHVFALSNDAEGLVSFLNSHPDSDINALDDYGYTPLHLAADRGSTSVAKTLIERGADTNIKDPDDFTALALAEFGDKEDIVRLLRDHAT